MKKTLLALFAAAAFVGCDQGTQDVNEPAGAERDTQMERSPGTNDTNTLTDPSGAASGQSGASQSDSSSGAASDASNP